MGQMQATNDDFADLQSEVQLWSFYESLKTELDDLSALVLERASAIIGILVFLPVSECQLRVYRYFKRENTNVSFKSCRHWKIQGA